MTSVADWLLPGAGGWPSTPVQNKIDTHHHFVPDFYAVALNAAGGSSSGWPTPAWSPQSSEALMDHLGIQTAIISITSPGVTFLEGQESYDMARKLNQYAADLRDKKPDTFGFFATLPSLLDTEAALSELTFAMDTLKADGVVIFTSYTDGTDDTYLGHAALDPIWAELNRREAVVFVHPTERLNLTQVNPVLQAPVIDYPHETTRTAMDMITQGTLQKFPNCKIILSHAGGTLPFAIGRVATSVDVAADFPSPFPSNLTRDSVMKAFRHFYYDLALSSTQENLDMVLEMIPHDHILYGCDFPYAPATAYPAFLKELETYDMPSKLRDKINFANAQALIPRLAKKETQGRL